MKILQVVHSLPFLTQAGTEIYAYELSLRLAGKHEVYLFSRKSDVRQEEYLVTDKKHNQVSIYLLNNTFRECTSFEYYYANKKIDIQFALFLDKVKPDIVHIHHLIFLSVGMIQEINKRKIPIVFTLHDYWLMCPGWHLLKKDCRPCTKAQYGKFDEECIICLNDLLAVRKTTKRFYFIIRSIAPKFLADYLRRKYFQFIPRMPGDNAGLIRLEERRHKIRGLLDRIDMFIVPSRYARDRFMEFGISQRRMRLLASGVDAGLFEVTDKIPSRKLRFGFIGTLLPAKGIHVLLEAFHKVKGEAELKIYGKLKQYIGFEYYLPYLKRIAKDKRIRFMGEFKHAESQKIFRELDVLAVPSIWNENAPLVIQEAFASRTPVIASRIGGIPELVSDGVDGILFQPGDVEGLYHKMQLLVSQPDIIDKLKRNISQVKNISDHAKEIEEIYSGLLTAKSYLS